MKKILLCMLCACSVVSSAMCKIDTLIHDDPGYTFVSATKDPYKGSVDTNPPLYLLVMEPVQDDNTFSSYCIYSSRKSGKPYSDVDSMLVYYNPRVQHGSIDFGPKPSSDVDEFVARVNSMIRKNGYAILIVFSTGGAKYTNFSIY